MPKSGEQEDHTAPMLVAASMAMIVWGIFGMNPTTRSPGRTPMARRAEAIRAVSS